MEEEKHEKARHEELEQRLDRLQESLDALLAERRDDPPPAKDSPAAD